jgi:hypothetical protein
MAKLFVAAGGFDQASGGERFSPTQLAFPGVLFPCFPGIGVPSLKAGEVRMKLSAASAERPPPHNPAISPPPTSTIQTYRCTDIGFLPFQFTNVSSASVVERLLI